VENKGHDYFLRLEMSDCKSSQNTHLADNHDTSNQAVEICYSIALTVWMWMKLDILIQLHIKNWVII